MIKPNVVLLALVASGVAGVSHAQYREGMPAVLEPPAAAPDKPATDIARLFPDAYAAAGKPRVILLWNRTLTDEASTQTQYRKVIRDNTSEQKSASTDSTHGIAGRSSQSDASRDHQRTRTETRGIVAVGPDVRRTMLTERESVQLERGFVSEMRRGGMRFIDRALVMRTTAAAQHREGVDRQLLETDALLRHGDLIMEVLLVADPEAPAGYAFDVRLKDILVGTSVASLYSRGKPAPSPAQQGAWKAGPEGYVFVRPAVEVPDSARIGAALAKDVMQELYAVWKD